MTGGWRNLHLGSGTTDKSQFDSQKGKRVFLYPKALNKVQEPSHSLLYDGYGGIFFLGGVKQQGHQADNSPPFVAELKRGVTTSFHPYNGKLSRDHHDDDFVVFTGTALHFTFLQILLG